MSDELTQLVRQLREIAAAQGAAAASRVLDERATHLSAAQREEVALIAFGQGSQIGSVATGDLVQGNQSKGHVDIFGQLQGVAVAVNYGRIELSATRPHEEVRSLLEQWLQHCIQRLQRDHLVRLADQLMACPSLPRLPLAALPDFTALCLELHFWDVKHLQLLTTLDDLLDELGLLLPITWRELLELRTLLANVTLSEEELEYLYGHSRPARWWQRPQGCDAATTLRLMIQQLAAAQVQMPEAQHPLVDFVHRLMAEYAPQIETVTHALAQWTQQVATRLGLAPRQVPATPQPTLLIKLKLAPGVVQPSLSQPHTVEVVLHAWLLPEVQDPLVTSRLCTLKEVKDDLPRLVRQACQKLSPTLSMTDLPIEFLLPLELLPYDVDQWPIQTGMRRTRERPVGQIHPVMVRSLDRIENPQQDAQLFPRWQQRWQSLQTPQAHDILVTVDNLAAYQLHHIERDLRMHGHKSLLLLTALTTANLDDLLELLDLAIELGVPAAILTRQCCSDPTHVATTLREAIARRAIHELPHLIREQRLEAESPQHPGQNLTLLWDDPQRMLPEMLYHTDRMMSDK